MTLFLATPTWVQFVSTSAGATQVTLDAAADPAATEEVPLPLIHN